MTGKSPRALPEVDEDRRMRSPLQGASKDWTRATSLHVSLLTAACGGGGSAGPSDPAFPCTTAGATNVIGLPASELDSVSAISGAYPEREQRWYFHPMLGMPNIVQGNESANACVWTQPNQLIPCQAGWPRSAIPEFGQLPGSGFESLASSSRDLSHGRNHPAVVMHRLDPLPVTTPAGQRMGTARRPLDLDEFSLGGRRIPRP